MAGIFPAVNSDSARKAVKQFRTVMFPEEAVNDAIYIAKAKDMMKKLMTTDVFIKPIESKEDGGYINVSKTKKDGEYINTRKENI